MRTLRLCCHELFNPHLRCWRMQCFFWELGERGSCSFSRSGRLNARCLFYMTRHLRCAFGCQRLVLSELFKFTTELPAPTLDAPPPPPPLHHARVPACNVPHTLQFLCMRSHFARFASLPGLSPST